MCRAVLHSHGLPLPRLNYPLLGRQVAHRHASDVRNYVHGVDTVTGSYAAVIPIKNLA